jgi:hypothetical protein
MPYLPRSILRRSKSLEGSFHLVVLAPELMIKVKEGDIKLLPELVNEVMRNRNAVYSAGAEKNNSLILLC